MTAAPSRAAGVARYRIGALARRTGRSVHTLRWYEKQGLIPGVQRDPAGRRVYSELHLGWVDLMDRLRRTGMSVAQMRRYTALVEQGRATLRARCDMLNAHRQEVLARIREWQASLALIDRKIDWYGEWIATGQRPPGDPLRRRARRVAAR